ncbi:MAG: ferredoxin reductase family protein [Acidobacteriota bacterium]
MSAKSAKKDSARWAGPLLVGLYASVLLAPLALLAALRPPTDHGFVYTVGKNLALVGFTILAMQFVLSARLKWVERSFGLDILFRFHKSMALLAVLLLISHPLLMALGSNKWSLLFAVKISWHIWAGRVALLILLVHIFLAVFRLVLRLEYQRWRVIHNLLAALVLPLGFVHSWNAGGDLSGDQEITQLRFLWPVLLALAGAAYLWHRVARPLKLRRRTYHVTDVLKETKDVWTIKLAPAPDGRRYDYLPGQFHFLTFCHDGGLPTEEHHFTISSSPTEPGFVSSTIKRSGDFTGSIGKAKPGDRVLVQGPFGRFSYVLHPQERNLVFIAGGIGITPLMSMLRHMRDTQADIRVLLLYANRKPEDIVFRHELAAIQAGNVPRLEVIHILSQAAEDWKGETGHIDQEKIKLYCGGDVANKAFYICAPHELTNAVLRCLQYHGVADKLIHLERFSP